MCPNAQRIGGKLANPIGSYSNQHLPDLPLCLQRQWEILNGNKLMIQKIENVHTYLDCKLDAGYQKHSLNANLRDR